MEYTIDVLVDQKRKDETIDLVTSWKSFLHFDVYDHISKSMTNNPHDETLYMTFVATHIPTMEVHGFVSIVITQIETILSLIGVHPMYRRQGIATILLERAEMMALTHRRSKTISCYVDMSDHVSAALFLRRGYLPDEHLTDSQILSEYRRVSRRVSKMSNINYILVHTKIRSYIRKLLDEKCIKFVKRK